MVIKGNFNYNINFAIFTFSCLIKLKCFRLLTLFSKKKRICHPYLWFFIYSIIYEWNSFPFLTKVQVWLKCCWNALKRIRSNSNAKTFGRIRELWTFVELPTNSEKKNWLNFSFYCQLVNSLSFCFCINKNPFCLNFSVKLFQFIHHVCFEKKKWNKKIVVKTAAQAASVTECQTIKQANIWTDIHREYFYK